MLKTCCDSQENFEVWKMLQGNLLFTNGKAIFKYSSEAGAKDQTGKAVT